MKEFPYNLNVTIKEHFPEVYYNRVLCYLRRDVYEHIIREDENSYFDLQKFQTKYKISTENRDKMSEKIMKELDKLGWKCKLSFGDTAMFIYSTEDVPKSCW